MSHEEQQQQKQDDKDRQEMLDAYRALKRLGKWAAAGFAFLLVMVSIALAFKQLFKS